MTKDPTATAGDASTEVTEATTPPTEFLFGGRLLVFMVATVVGVTWREVPVGLLKEGGGTRPRIAR